MECDRITIEWDVVVIITTIIIITSPTEIMEVVRRHKRTETVSHKWRGVMMDVVIHIYIARIRERIRGTGNVVTEGGTEKTVSK